MNAMDFEVSVILKDQINYARSNTVNVTELLFPHRWQSIHKEDKSNTLLPLVSLQLRNMKSLSSQRRKEVSGGRPSTDTFSIYGYVAIAPRHISAWISDWI
jgi:hypothetical protein